MSRKKNDGKGRLGGRQKGTLNKTTAIVKEWVTDVVYKNRELFEEDIKKLHPKERVIILEKLLQYVVPKQQSEVADVSLSTPTIDPTKPIRLIAPEDFADN